MTAFAVSETAVNDDLNGDGDTLDAVVHVFRAADGVTVTVAFVIAEGAQGETDLNGDEDTFDDVLCVYDARKNRLIETGLAAAHGIGRDVSLFRFVYPPAVLEDTVVFLVHEPPSYRAVNIGLAAATVFGNGILFEHVPFAVHIRSGKARLAE